MSFFPTFVTLSHTGIKRSLLNTAIMLFFLLGWLICCIFLNFWLNFARKESHEFVVRSDDNDSDTHISEVKFELLSMY